MSKKGINSPMGYCKITILISGAMTAVMAMHSHLNSDWYRYRNHEICSHPLLSDKSCPGISMERYFVSAVVICHFFSIFNFVATVLGVISTGVNRWIDIGFHAFSTAFLLIGAVVYIVSTEQIHNINWANKNEMNLLRSEKLAAGSLCVIQSLVYGATALLIALT